MELASFGSVRVLFVMAAVPEYGPALRALIRPLITGVGPVEAAISVTRALAGLAVLPDLVVSLGSAGSARLARTRVYQADRVAWRDMDASALGFPKGVTPFLDQPAVLPLGLAIPGVPKASLSTGGNVVSGPGYATIAEDMVDMETYAVLRAAQVFGLPLIALRGISDGDRDLGGLQDWTEYLHLVDENLAAAVTLMARALQSGGLSALR